MSDIELCVQYDQDQINHIIQSLVDKNPEIKKQLDLIVANAISTLETKSIEDLTDLDTTEFIKEFDMANSSTLNDIYEEIISLLQSNDLFLD